MTDGEMIDYLGRVAVHLANASRLLGATEYRRAEVNKKVLEAYRAVMSIKRSREEMEGQNDRS